MATPTAFPASIQRAKDAVATARIDEYQGDEAQDIAYDAMEATDPASKIGLIEQALDVYPLCTEAWGLLGYHYLKEEPSLALVVFETGVTAARRIDSSLGPDRTELLEWCGIENRPYLRAMRGLALAAANAGDLTRAIETAELLAKWRYFALRSQLSSWYLQAQRWDDAETFIAKLTEEHEDGYMDCGTAYSMVLLKYQRLRQGHPVAFELDQALVAALKKNLFVPELLIADEPPAGEDIPSYDMGSDEESTYYARDNYALWRSIPGAVEWLAFTRGRGGAKPDEETLIQLLRHQLVPLQLSNGKIFLGTQCRERMLGTALPEFQMPLEVTAPHLASTGTPICVQDHTYGPRNINDLWTHFQYDDLVDVPFWNVFLVMTKEEADKEEDKQAQAEARKCWNCSALETPENKHKQCANCSVATYCSRQCQRKHWKQHRIECNRMKQSKIWGELDTQTLSVITSFLDLKEKAMVSTLNKAWLEASTCDKAVTINPDVVGTNLNAVLAFVGSRFRYLQDVSISIDQHYFLGSESPRIRDPLVQLHGNYLRRFFENCPTLRSVDIAFDDCVEEYTSRILVEEGGFDTLSRHTSMKSLVLTFSYFDNLQSLAQTLQPLANLQQLSLWYPVFHESAYQGAEGRMPSTPWRLGSELLAVIGTMRHLRKLALNDHGLVDADLHHLIPILPKLRGLELDGRFGSHPPNQVSLTDAALELIAGHCHQLQLLSVSYNKRITMGGIRNAVSACPLRELSVSDTGFSSNNLLETIELCSSLVLVRYGSDAFRISGHHQNLDHLREATIASGGRVLFVAGELYVPTFDEELMQRQEETKGALEKLEANASNGWNEWEDWR